MNRCCDCHWHTGNYELKSNGKILPCANIGADGWENWLEQQREPESCEGYCKAGEYVPAGVWAQIAGVVQKITEIAKEGATDV